jgi:hypothetical protein
MNFSGLRCNHHCVHVMCEDQDVWTACPPDSNAWTRVATASNYSARYDHAAVALGDGTLVIMGGFSFVDMMFNDVWASSDGGVTWREQIR